MDVGKIIPIMECTSAPKIWNRMCLLLLFNFRILFQMFGFCSHYKVFAQVTIMSEV